MQGLRTLADRDERALRLVQALDDGQRKKAVFAEKAPAEIRAAATPQPPTDPAVGIAYGRDERRPADRPQALVESYAMDMPIEVAKAWLDEISIAGSENIKFTWAGPADRSQGHAYRIQGPTFLIEFNNTQNNANHVHSVWRNMLGDFAIPLNCEMTFVTLPACLPSSCHRDRNSTGDIMNDWTRRDFLAAGALAVAQADAPEKAGEPRRTRPRRKWQEPQPKAAEKAAVPAERENRARLHRRRRHGNRA